MLQRRKVCYLHSTQLVVRRSKIGNKVVALLLLAVERLGRRMERRREARRLVGQVVAVQLLRALRQCLYFCTRKPSKLNTRRIYIYTHTHTHKHIHAPASLH